MSGLDILVVGAGAYVAGGESTDLGTVLPTLLGLQQDGRVGRIRVAASRPESVSAARARLAEMEDRLGARAEVEWWPRGSERDPEAYLPAATETPRPQAAVVVVPDALHHRVTSQLLARGLHCLVAKPLAPTAGECRDLAEQARRTGLLGQVEFHKRFDEANRILRREIRSGALGDLSHILVEYSQRTRVPLRDFRRWAGESQPFQYLGVHYVDLIAWWTGARPVRASAVGTRRVLESAGIDSWDAVQATVEWRAPSGRPFHALFSTSWIDPEGTSAMSQQIVKVIGTRGRLDSDQKRRGLERADHERHEELNPYFSQWLPHGEHLRLEGYGPRSIADFVDNVTACLAGDELTSSAARFADAVVSSAVSEAVSASLARGGRWIEIAALPRRARTVRATSSGTAA